MLQSNGIALDVPLGELQYAVTKLPERIAVHGGEGGYEGIKNMQIRAGNNSTLEALELPPVIEGSRRLTSEGYPIGHGSSFVMALEFTDDGPVADAILSYSQSGDPQSPHFTDQTRLFERKQWRPIHYRETDISANTSGHPSALASMGTTAMGRSPTETKVAKSPVKKPPAPVL